MHSNPIFRRTPRERDIAFAQNRAFGTLVVPTPSIPMIAHVPFLLSSDGTRAEAHLVRSNPILSVLDDQQPVTLIVSGGDCYVSPDWYGVEDQVPTWNYIAIHLSGDIERLPQSELCGVLERLSAAMEAQIDDKSPWTIDKMTPTVFDKTQNQIVPIAVQITDIQSTWKLSQYKPDVVIANAQSGISQHPIGSNVGGVVAAMSPKS